MSWDLPVPTSTNHDWLFQELLSHAVIFFELISLLRVRQPVKQMRKGIKETESGLFLRKGRMFTDPFPRESNFDPAHQLATTNSSSDEDEPYPVPLEKVSVVTGFLRQFIEEVSPDILRNLMRFWVGWELPSRYLNVEVVTAKHPVALTCFTKLKLPSHYKTYEEFYQDMMMALGSIDSGFGLV
ncbi:hypothetical protein F7725_024559 [Dissostichus mawsoni]|uniref:HECT domain-containing protein n=1 Tax=Dissostichus mawsoni TaxID=36200 RepID=A0A7J5Y2P0_DISMA|nr:hypothetical protein F7725_024559 [Dissostichus mawsoni]